MLKRLRAMCVLTAVVLPFAFDLRATERPIEEPIPGNVEEIVLEVRDTASGVTGGQVIGIPAVRWAPPLPPTASSRSRNFWLASILALAGANCADVLSSRNLAEHNPLLRNSMGGFDARKAAFIKTGATGGLVLVQFLLRRRARDGHLDMPFTAVNAAAAGVVGATAARNVGLRR